MLSTQKNDSLSVTPPAPVPATHVAFVSPTTLYCEICRINGHVTNDYQMVLVKESIIDHVDFVNNNQLNNLHSNTYILGWQDHPIFFIRTTNLNKLWDHRVSKKL